MNEPTTHDLKLAPERLRWRCNPESLSFQTTADLEPLTSVIGQNLAVDALRFGLGTSAPGQNIFVRGLTGTGRMTLLQRLFEEIKPACPSASDRCYVRNFAQPDRPKLITLPRGEGRKFGRVMTQLAEFIRDDLREALNADPMRARRNSLEKQMRDEIEQTIKPFDADLRQAGLAIVTVREGAAARAAIFPLANGQPVPPEEFENMVRQQQIPQEQYETYKKNREAFQERFDTVSSAVYTTQQKYHEMLRRLVEDEVRATLFDHVARIVDQFPYDPVKTYLSDVVDDLVSERLPQLEQDVDFSRLYLINVIQEHAPDADCPIIIENTPNVANLLGTIDRDMISEDTVIADHLTIRAGSLLRADGGFLILDARDVLSEPGAWKMLSRTLRTGRLEIVPSETQVPWAVGYSLKPEPIDINVKVVLLGDAQTYYLLDAYEYDFQNLFKVLADFDSTIERSDDAVQQFARVLARIAKDEDLPGFDRTAVASLAEHGARIADRSNRLTTRFGRLADIAREAAFLAGNDTENPLVSSEHVHEAIRRTRHRANLPARRFREFVREGTIRIVTSGTAVGQINGLAVLQSGPLTYGFPARITATIGPGTAGVINIEREAALSGAIHTKGFYILGGLLRTLLRTDHPLAFSASIAFEQSYGGIDGDSASGAEICSLLSALTRVPIRQDLAMTGAIDQMGNILPIGAATAKIEGFFDVCNDIGLTGTQGVLIPRANAGDLMLRPDVVAACADGKFAVYAVDTVHQALELLTGMPAGQADENGRYPKGTLLHIADDKALQYWKQASPAVPQRIAQQIQPERAEPVEQPDDTALR